MGHDSPQISEGTNTNKRSPAAWTGRAVADPSLGRCPFSSSCGMEVRFPVVSNVHPWYGHSVLLEYSNDKTSS
jgi:hypothetical protein